MNIEEFMLKQFQGLNENFDKLTDKVDDVSKDVAKLQAKTDGLCSRTDDISNRLNAQDSRSDIDINTGTKIEAGGNVETVGGNKSTNNFDLSQVINKGTTLAKDNPKTSVAGAGGIFYFWEEIYKFFQPFIDKF